MKKAAVVITTYNQSEFLGLCLKSYTNQTHTDFDIFIADDGSKSDTRYKIDQLRSELPGEVHHVWQEDHGYQKARINNIVFAKIQKYPVSICVDGDTIAHHRFVEDHLKMHSSQQETLFMGRRVDLGEEITGWLTEDRVCDFNQGLSPKLLMSGLSNDSKNVLRAVRIENPLMQKLTRRDDVHDILGSNFSVSTSLLYRVNGYDEDYRSYWGEDGDLFVRIRNTGAQIIGRKSYAIQYHLNHPRLTPTPEHRQKYQERVIRKDYRFCANGIRKLEPGD